MTRRLLSAFLLLSLAALAQQKPTALERLQRMTPEERNRFLDRIPPDRRMDLERRLREMDSIPADVRARLRREYDEFQQLPPERQQAIRRVLKEINDLPPRRRAAVRAALGMLRQQTPSVREDRMNSKQFKMRFEESDQRLVREALEVLPPISPAPPAASSEEKL